MNNVIGRMSKKPIWISSLVYLIISLGLVPGAQAQTLILGFDSLPSSQGWTYIGAPLTETEAFTVDGTTLSQNTVDSGPSSLAVYRIEDIILPSQRMTLSFTARVLEQEFIVGTGGGGLGFAFRIVDPTLGHVIGLTENLVLVNGQVLGLDATVFHDYVLEMHPGGDFELFVDGALAATGVGLIDPGFLVNALQFGDHTHQENANAEITAMTFTVHSDSLPQCNRGPVGTDLAVLDATFTAFPVFPPIANAPVSAFGYDFFPAALVTNLGPAAARNILVNFELLDGTRFRRARGVLSMLDPGQSAWVTPGRDQIGRTKIRRVLPDDYILRTTVSENGGFSCDPNEFNNQFEIPVILPGA